MPGSGGAGGRRAAAGEREHRPRSAAPPPSPASSRRQRRGSAANGNRQRAAQRAPRGRDVHRQHLPARGPTVMKRTSGVGWRRWRGLVDVQSADPHPRVPGEDALIRDRDVGLAAAQDAAVAEAVDQRAAGCRGDACAGARGAGRRARPVRGSLRPRHSAPANTSHQRRRRRRRRAREPIAGRTRRTAATGSASVSRPTRTPRARHHRDGLEQVARDGREAVERERDLDHHPDDGAEREPRSAPVPPQQPRSRPPATAAEPDGRLVQVEEPVERSRELVAVAARAASAARCRRR